MSINMRSLTPQAYTALEQFCSKMDWQEIQGFMEPEAVAWLVEKLKHAPDKDEIFPSGKWALIQFLQNMLSEYAAKEFPR